MKMKARKKATKAKKSGVRLHDERLWLPMSPESGVGGPGKTITIKSGTKIVIEDYVALVLAGRVPEERMANELAFIISYVPLPAKKDEAVAETAKPGVIAAHQRLYRWMAQYNKKFGRVALAVSYAEGEYDEHGYEGEGAHVRVDPETAKLYPNLPTEVLGYPVRVYDTDYSESATDKPEDLAFAPEEA